MSDDEGSQVRGAMSSSPRASVYAFADASLGRGYLQVVEACSRPQIPALLRADLAREKDGAKRLDELCATLIAVALRRGGVFIDGRALWPVDDVCRRLGVRGERRSQIQRLLEILQEDAWLHRDRDGFRWVGPALPDASHIAAAAASLEADFPFAAGVSGLLLRCMAALPAVLAGHESPVAVLFASGSVAELEVFYSRFPLLALANAMAASAARCIADLCKGHDLRVLEVGAGTGALTAALLPAIGKSLGDYVYSDISASFLAHGRSKFARTAALRPLMLDIDKEPASQGLAAESFDLVTGANVVHATPDVRRAIRHLARMLRPGGHLLLVETVCRSRVADCTVGLLDGWWSFRDPQLRDGYPLLNAPQWQRLLQDEGFHAASVPVGPADDASPTRLVVLVAVKL